MDASAFATVGVVSSLLSRHLISTLAPSPSVRKLVHASLILCLMLFALTIIDAAPQEWNIIIGRSALTFTYKIVLWMIAINVLLVSPLLFSHHLTCWKPTFSFPASCAIALYTIQRTLSILACPIRLIRRIVRSRRRRSVTLPVHVAQDTETTPSYFGLRDILSGFLGIGVMWFVLQLIGPLSVPQESSSDLTILTRLISCLSTVGVLLSAVLNGFGSVSLPFQHLSGMFLKAVPDHAIASAEQELEKAAAALQQRQDELKGGRSLPVKMNSTTNSFITMGNDITTRKYQLQSEIEFLQRLVGELVDDVTEMRLAKVAAARARTRLGKVRSVIGIAFSIILCVRLAAAFWNIWITSLQGEQRGRGSDPVTMALVWMIGRQWVATEHYNSLSQFLSLVLTAILSFTQMNTFIRTVAIIHRRFLFPWLSHCNCFKGSDGSGTQPTQYGASSSLLTILITLLMTCYCLACVVLTKNMVPRNYRQSFSQALGAAAEVRPYPVHLTFALSATISLGTLVVLLGIQRQNTQRYNKTANDSSAFWLDP